MYNCNNNISVPSIISCFIFWNSLRTSLIISTLKASISCAVNEVPSLTPFTLRRVSSEAEPNLLRTDFGDSAPLENLLFDVLFLSQDFLSGELSGSCEKNHSIFLFLFFSRQFFDVFIKTQSIQITRSISHTGGCSGCFFSAAARRRARVLAISSIMEAIPPPPPLPKVP